jgi:HK97 family phage major capsid protein
MDITQLKQLIQETTDDAVKAALAEQLKGALEAQAVELKSNVAMGYQTASQYSAGFMRTKSGSLVNPLAARNSLDGTKEYGNYWIELSKKMEDFAKEFAGRIKDMTVSSNTSGGFLVPEEFEASIIQYREPTNIVWPRANIVPMQTDTLIWPKLAQVSTGTVNHFGGVVFTWTEEATAKTETQPSFENITLQAKELSAFTQISDTLLADTPINLMNFLTDLFRRAWMWTTDGIYVTGDAAGKPLGVIEDPNVIIVNRGAANTVTLADISNMYEQHPTHFMNGAVWFMNKVIAAGLLDERSTTNDLLLRNMVSIKEGVLESLKGHPVVLSDNKTPALGAKGDVILGNWREGYYIGRRQGITVARSEHYAFINNMTTIRATGRVAGLPAQPKAFVVLDAPTSGS